MGRYTAPQGELPRQRGHEEAMRAKVPGKMSHLTSRCPAKLWFVFGGKSQILRQCRRRKRVNMSALSDSGFEEDLQSPSPSQQQLPAPWSGLRLAAEDLHSDHDDSCFIIQTNKQEDFLALDCLARQPQVTGVHLKLSFRREVFRGPSCACSYSINKQTAG